MSVLFIKPSSVRALFAGVFGGVVRFARLGLG